MKLTSHRPKRSWVTLAEDAVFEIVSLTSDTELHPTTLRNENLSPSTIDTSNQ